MNKLTIEDLDLIEARANAAPEGPWSAMSNSISGVSWVVRQKPFADGVHGNMVMMGHQAECEFVAHAREDVPALVTEVRWLQKELTEVRKMRDDLLHQKGKS